MRALLLLLLCLLASCGARSGLALDDPFDAATPPPRDDGPELPDRRPDRIPPPPDLPPPDRPPPDIAPGDTVSVRCPAAQAAIVGEAVNLAGAASSSAGLPLSYQWTVERSPAPEVLLADATSPVARVNPPAPGEYVFRLTATASSGASGSCTATLRVEAAIDLLCPNDSSHYVSETVSLEGRASSRLGRAVTLAWTIEANPSGSVTRPTPATGPRSALLLDREGDWVLRLTALDAAGLRASCTVRVHADPDVVVGCPPDLTSRPFTTVSLAARAESRLRLPLTFRWTTERRPATSTAALASPAASTTAFTFDVAGDWTWRFTATSSRGNSASCTARALAASTEAVRVELVWNMDRSCRGCNPEGGGIDIDLHVADLARSGGRWASLAPGDSDCYYANCRCRGPEPVCPEGALDWPPPGTANNPQLDIDHIQDLPGPENVNILQAAASSRFVVGVHYFADHTSATERGTPTPAVVRVYCSGRLVFESEAVRLEPLGSSGSSTANPLWRVGVITTSGDGRSCTFERCGRPGDVRACIRPQQDW